MSLAGVAMEAILSALALGQSLASSSHPFRYVSSPAVMLLTMLGAWAGLSVVNRMR